MVKLLTPAEAAAATGLTVLKIVRLCNAGAFGRNVSQGKRPTWVIREDDLFNFFRVDQPEEPKTDARRSRIDSAVEKVF